MANETLFLDTAYVLALFNSRDQWHRKAIEWQIKVASDKNLLITTEFVLTEIGDGLSSRNLRAEAGKIIRALHESTVVRVVPASTVLFIDGLQMFENRDDKDWGMTDCTSFVVMNENKITAALTTDEHFRQAGFNPLLLD